MTRCSSAVESAESLSAESLFDAAVRDFQDVHSTDGDGLDLSKFQSIDDIYQEVYRIQEEQGRKGTLRNMKKMAPFLDCLQQYSSVLDTFVQVKPDILALVWGPIKLLLQVSKNYVQGFDKVLEMTRKLGLCLPHFKKYTEFFKENKSIREILSLFYRDILDFYSILLSFFQTKGWKTFFEVLWPRFAAKISVVSQSVEHHKSLLNTEVTFADIQDARVARGKALEEYEKSERSRERQQFEVCKSSLIPRLYDQELERMQNERCKDTCAWLELDDDFQRWFSSRRRSAAFLWLLGIPGAGKSHLSAKFVSRMRSKKENVLFAFLSFQRQESASRVAILHSMIFQLLYEHQVLRPALLKAYDCDYRELQSFGDYNQQLLADLLQCIGVTYIVLDGLDEIAENERQVLLKGFLQMSSQCPDLKVLVSSREETDIANILQSRALSVRIGLRNTEDIRLYFNRKSEDWLDGLEIEDTTYSSLRTLLQSIPERAQGMFLYVKLVIENLKGQLTLEDIRKEVADLPAGLEAAYGRILERIKNLQPVEQAHAKTILAWISCSKVPLRKQELVQALMILEGDQQLISERRILQDIVKICGPLIEVDGDLVFYVHFTAKEYLESRHSGPFIREVSAHRQIAHTCMTYLMFTCFDPSVHEEEIKSAVLAGEYVLHAYAASHWLDHVKDGGKDSSDSSAFGDLCHKISMFLTRRANSNFKRKSAVYQDLPDLMHFKRVQPHVYEWLGFIIPSVTQELTNSVEAKINSKTRYERNPLVLEQTWHQTQLCYETLICPPDRHLEDCVCPGLEDYYGSRLLKCTRLACNFSRIGFGTKIARDRHAQSHMRSFKCGFGNCKFAKVGFFSQSQLKQHTELSHVGQTRNSNEEVVLDIAEESLEQAMLDAMELGESDYLSVILDKLHQPPLTLLIHLGYLKGSNASILNTLATRGAKVDDRESLKCLAKSGHPDASVSHHIWMAMKKIKEEYNIFHSADRSISARLFDGPQTALTEAIEGGSVETVQWVLAQGVDVKENLYDNEITATPVDYLFARQLSRSRLKWCHRSLPLDIIKLLLESGTDVIDGRALHSLVQCHFPSDEQPLYQEAATLLLKHGSQVRKDALHYLIGGNYSCELGHLLIEKGADLENLYESDGTETPLIRCLKANHKKSAEFARFLLESGARANLKAKDITRAEGFKLDPKKFAKWTGANWDELVESMQASNAAANLPAVNFATSYPRPK